MTTSTVPIGLQELDRFVIWKEEEIGGRLTKVPYQANAPQYRASSTDSSTWSSFSAATAAMGNDSTRFGLGFAVGSGRVCIDFDGCRDRVTGVIEEWALTEIEVLDSYTEISPSGTGLHVWVITSTVPANIKVNFGREHYEMEMYGAGKYYTVTGNRWAGSCDTIEERDLSDLYQRMLTKQVGPTEFRVNAAYRDQQQQHIWVSATEDNAMDVPGWCARHGIRILRTKTAGGLTIHEIECPGSHGTYKKDDGRAWIGQDAAGMLLAGCWHSSCNLHDAGWRGLRDLVEPRASETVPAPACEEPAAPWPELDPDALYGLAGDIVRTISPHSEADPVALLVQTLAAFGNIIDRASFWTHEASIHALVMFVVLVGASSKARKGTSWAWIKSLFERVDPAWKAHSGGLSSGEGLIYAVRDADESTDEKQKDQGVSDKRLLVNEQEFHNVLTVMSRAGNTLSPLLRQAWDGLTLQPLTKNARIKATRPHISLIGHITEDELRSALTATQMGNGFGNRFLWLCCRRSKLLPHGGQVPEEQLQELRERLAAAADFGKQHRKIERAPDAERLWELVYEELSADGLGLVGAMTARAEAQTMRLAAIYALMDRSAVIRGEHLQAGLALWEYCAASVKRIFGEALGDPIADSVLAALKQRPEGMSRTDIRDYFARNQSSASIAAALLRLQRAGLAVMQMDKSKPGRPAETWRYTGHRS